MQTKAFLYAVNHALVVSTLFHDLSWQWLCFYFMNKKDDPPLTILDPGKTLLETILTHIMFHSIYSLYFFT